MSTERCEEDRLYREREREGGVFLWKLEEEENGDPFESEQSNYYWFGFYFEGYLRERASVACFCGKI